LGDIISIGEALVITFFSIAVVFIGLILLSLCISVLKIVSGEKEPNDIKESKTKAVIKDSTEDKVEEDVTNDEELVAVIATAIAASLGVSVPDINISSIRRRTQNTTSWAAASRQEQIYGKL